MLDDRKVKALELLQKGTNVTNICKEVGISRPTFYAWLNNDADFKKAKEHIENTLLEHLSTIALMESEDLLLNGTSYERIQMIQQILKLKRQTDLNVTVTNDVISLDDMLKRI